MVVKASSIAGKLLSPLFVHAGSSSSADGGFSLSSLVGRSVPIRLASRDG